MAYLKVIVHKYAGILSAYGMALADVVQEVQEPCGLIYSKENAQLLQSSLKNLSERCNLKLKSHGFSEIELIPFLHLRYEGTDCALMCSPSKDLENTNELSIPGYGNFESTFLKRYRTEFGFVLQNRKIIVDDIRVRGLGKNTTPPEQRIENASNIIPDFDSTVKVYFDHEEVEAPVYLTSMLKAGHEVKGPAIIIDQLSTILVEPSCVAKITNLGDIVIQVGVVSNKVDEKLDAVQLSIFSHRFMSIAEQMGRYVIILFLNITYKTSYQFR